jgi:hypothetical protein
MFKTNRCLYPQGIFHLAVKQYFSYECCHLGCDTTGKRCAEDGVTTQKIGIIALDRYRNRPKSSCVSQMGWQQQTHAAK